ncbi:unnamed protein product [Linum trigynum]|uniref:Uncharacterized protein n=1 Tax=Linum trigynum TaxID=586398 RepID=A0AAV2D6N5_9ROSI
MLILKIKSSSKASIAYAESLAAFNSGAEVVVVSGLLLVKFKLRLAPQLMVGDVDCAAEITISSTTVVEVATMIGGATSTTCVIVVVAK